MSRIRLGVTIVTAAALALVALGAASARTDAVAKYGGTLVVGVSSGDPDSLDPTLGRNTFSLTFFRTMCEQLYTFDDRLRPVPVLAASLPVISKDKRSYTVQLRKGIEFNDGTPLDAQAVVTTIRRFIDYPGSVRASDFLGVESVTALGPYTVVYHLAKWSSVFTGNTYVLSPTQIAKLDTNFASDPVCVGPFKFDERVAGDHVTLVKSEHYYDQKDVYLDRIVFKPMQDAPSATAALKAGDIDVITQASTTELDGIRQSSNLRVLEKSQLGWAGLYINIGNKNGAGNPPDSPVGTHLSSSAKLRQAFEEAIDRDALNRVVFNGFMQVSCSPIAPANTLWYDATRVPCTPYNPKHAKKLVAESGISNPTVRLLVPSGPDNLRLAQFVQAQEAVVGIDVVIEATDSATSVERAAAGNYDTFYSNFGPGMPDPSFAFNRFLSTSEVMNYSGFSSARLDLILSNGLKARDTKARATLYRAAQQIVHDERPIIYLYNRTALTPYSTSLAGVRLAYNGSVLLTNARFK